MTVVFLLQLFDNQTRAMGICGSHPKEARPEEQPNGPSQVDKAILDLKIQVSMNCDVM